MRGIVALGALLYGVVLLGASGSGALTLADLNAGGSFVTENGIKYEDFTVKVKGGKRLSRDLSDYAVEVIADGFVVRGIPGSERGDGRIVMKYAASTVDPEGVIGACLEIGMDDPSSMVKAKKKLIDANNKKRRTKLFATPKGGRTSIEVDTDGPQSLRIKDKIFAWHGFQPGSSVTSRLKAVPEPGTLLLVGLGLGLLAGRRSARGH